MKTNIYDGGRYWIWPWNKFITFPRTLPNIEFSDDRGAQGSSLNSRTEEGLAIQLSVAFQYKLLPEKLYEIYLTYNSNYEYVFERIARDTIRKTAGNYPATEYWLNRSRVGFEMTELLNKTLYDAGAEVA